MELYKDLSRSFEERAADLVSRMTLEEKISQLGNRAAPIPHLGVPRYNYWNEASHGYFAPFQHHMLDVTSFPVCLAMSQTWDPELIKKVANVISDEVRVYHNTDGDELHMWCPTINLARDPRNGRSDENFGEDPFLAGKLAAKYVQGMQGNDKKYLKTVSTPKHYMLNSSENNRHRGSDNADEATIREYYGRVFEYAIREGKAQSIMTAYNRINGVPASCNDFMLTTLLREEWGFDGMVVSDCGAVGDTYWNEAFNHGDVHSGHYWAKSVEEASAMTLIAGTDMSCGQEHSEGLKNALDQGIISEDILDRALIRIFSTRFRLGLFEEKGAVPYDALGKADACTEEKQTLAREVANESIVLLRNDKNLLPLDKKKMKSVLVIGPNAIYRELGGYSCGGRGSVDSVVNVLALAGIQNELAGTDVEVRYEKGWCTGKENPRRFHLPGSEDQRREMIRRMVGPDADVDEILRIMQLPDRYPANDPDKGADNYILFERALAAAKKADYVIVIAGTDSTNAAEELDRTTLELPYGQNEKIKKLLDANENTVVVISALGMVTGDFFDKAHTVVNAHFGGQEQGTAIANVLFGKVNPSGKLSATWYKEMSDLPHVNDYGLREHDTLDMKTRTYQYLKTEPRFPFGHGLSYTTFAYSNLKLDKAELDANDTLHVTCDVTNTGKRAGTEIVELYIGKIIPAGMHDNKPARQLKGFAKVELKPGETKTVAIDVKLSEVTFWSNLRRKMMVESGQYNLEIGGSSANLPLKTTFAITGAWDARLCTVYMDGKQIYSPGQTGRIRVSATLEDATHLCMFENKPVFTSSDETVATVSAEGVVTAVAAGTAKITATVTYQGVSVSRSLPIAVK